MKEALTKNDISASCPSQRGPKPDHAHKRLFAFLLIISLCFHLGFFLILPLIFPQEPPHTPTREINVVFKERSENEKNKQLISVEQDNERRPKKADFLAEKNHEAIEEMKQEPKPQAVDDSLGSPSSSPDEAPDIVHAPSLDDFLQAPPAQPRRKKDPLGLKSGLPVLAPKNTNDYVDNVKNGERTDINAWQWRHAPFFNRVKAAVGRIWAPNQQISRYDPRGVLLGQKDRTTVMSITIDQAGNLRDLKIADTSGVAYLDEEAERTFKAAAPFPFPPKELFKDRDEFTFYFAFHVAISRGLSFDFEWQNPN